MKEPKKVRTTLSNGLPLVTIELPYSKSLRVSYWSKSGSRANPKDKAGLAHFFEHLLLKKTKNYPTDLRFACELEKIGAYKNGTTGIDWLHFDIYGSSEATKETLQLMSEMIFNPLIDKEGFDAERKVIFQEIDKKFSNPTRMVWYVWFKAVFSGTPLENSVLGEKQTLKVIKEFDINDYWQKYICSQNGLLLVSGGDKTNEMVSICEKYFGSRIITKEASLPRYLYEESKKKTFEFMDIPQASVLLSFRLDNATLTKDLYPLLLLRAIMAVGQSSIVAQRLRVRESLIYSWDSGIERYLDANYLWFNLATSTSSFSRLISVFSQIITDLRNKGIKDRQLKLSNKYIRLSILSNMETSNDYAGWYAMDELLWPERVDTVGERLDKLAKVTVQQVNGVVRKYLSHNRSALSVVGKVDIKGIKLDI
jgi:predicted Zn-dependent peptidase